MSSTCICVQNHCHRAKAQLQLNKYYYYIKIVFSTHVPLDSRMKSQNIPNVLNRLHYQTTTTQHHTKQTRRRKIPYKQKSTQYRAWQLNKDGLCCSDTMHISVTVWFGWGGVVSLCRLKHQCLSLHPDTTPHHTTPTEPHRNTKTHRIRATQPMK